MLVLKCCEAGRAGHTSGGTAVQTGCLVSWRCTSVQWLGGLDLRQEGLQYVTAWDAAVCTAPAYN